MSGKSEKVPAAIIALLLLLLALPFPVARGTLRVSDVAVRAEPDSLFSGERIRYTITVRHDQARQVAVEGLEAGPSRPFELVSRTETSKRLADGSQELRVSTELAAFGPGRLRLPGFTVTETSGGKMLKERLPYRPASSVVVLSMTDSTMTKLRPASPPIGPGFLPWAVLLVALGFLLLMVLGMLYLLKQWIQRNSPGALIDPSKAARQKLKSLDRQLTKGLAPAEGYETLSNILREFLQHRYRFRAMEQVTGEISEELDRRQVRARETVLKLLVRADLIKFADGRPDIEECRSSLKVAEAFFLGAADPLDSVALQVPEPPPAAGLRDTSRPSA